MPRAIVLIVDGLGAKHLGPYGNTWIETPAFNHLATESLLIENVYAPFADPFESVDALWRGDSTRSGHASDLHGTSLLDWLDSKDVHTKLLTDDADLVDQKLAGHFAEQIEIEQASGIKLAEEWDETHTARFFAQSISAVEQMSDNSLLWLHTAGFGNPWDAPYAHRRHFADEEDPEPTGSAQVPSLFLDKDYDPDTLHEIQCAFAGQVVLIDQCFGVLYSVVRDVSNSSDLLFMMTSPRGFPLGEHLHVGWKHSALYHELLHVPGFVRFPDGQHALCRRPGLGELRDLTHELMSWFSGEEVPNRDVGQNRIWSTSRNSSEILLRTAAWQMRFPTLSGDRSSDSAVCELYFKPDDQNEANDVSDRCSDVVEAGWNVVQKIASFEDSAEQIEIEKLLSEPPD